MSEQRFGVFEKILLTVTLLITSPIFLAMTLYRFLGSMIEAMYLLWTDADLNAKG